MTPAADRLYPLTSPQREIWFDQLLHDGIPLYNIGGYVKLPGAIDPVLFEQAANLLVQKHDTLRLLLVQERDEDGIPLQTFADTLSIKVPMHDFSNQENPHEAAIEWMQARFREPFELTEQPLFRYDLVKLREDCYYWLLQYHHLIVDGYAVALLNRSLAAIYTQLATGQVPNLESPSYTTFIDYDRAYVTSETFETQRQYWLNKYPTRPEPLFRARSPSPATATATAQVIGSSCEVLYLPRDFYNRLKALAKQHHATLFHLLLGALYVYFTRTAQRDDLAIGLPVLNRANAQFKHTAGLFTGVSPTWFQFGQELSFAELLQQINQTLKANYRHQRFPVSEINRAVGLGAARSQLFEINLSYENHDYDARFGTIESYFTAVLHSWEQTPLMIFVRDFHAQAAVKFDFVYNQSYFNTDDLKAIQARFVTILEAVLKDSVLPIYTLPVMTALEVQQLRAWNDTAVAYPQDLTLVDLFEQQVAKTPENLAVVFETQSLTYRQLNEKANQLAHYLLDLTTFKKLSNLNGLSSPNPLIAIAVERSLEMVIGLLGILKAGGAYVPIDPSYPAARIHYMLEDSAAPLLLTQSHLKAQLSLETLEHECVVVCLEEATWAGQATVNPLVNRQVEDLVYVIYTSGSTGKPKGVSLPQVALVNLLLWQSQQPSLAPPANTLQFTTLSFDVSCQEIFSTWLTGGQLVLVAEETRRDASALFNYLSSRQIERLFVPMVMLQLLAEQQAVSNLEALRLQNIITAGEQLRLTPAITAWFQTLPQCRLHNHYGPTESHVVTALTLPVATETWTPLPPIGQPIANVRIYLLDQNHQPQPPGVPGELCIAGTGLARGYLNRPDLTAAKFIEVELFGQTERIYKTGDLARWRPDGNLEYLGRLDHQVKLRGFRIELGEIEAVLSQHQAVKEAVVTLYEADDNKRLVAYLTTDADSSALVTTLKDWLTARLPDYMIPSQFTVLEKLPLTPNGKLDRQALPAPVLSTLLSAPPVTPTEDLLASLWAGVLKREAINREDNFFELGGHSLLATQLIARIRDSFQVELPVRAVFEHPQLSSLATAIAAATGTVRLPPIEVQPANAPQLLSFSQQRLWFLSQLEENESATYNMPVALRLTGNLKVEALQQSLRWLLERHTSLRSAFPTQDGRATVQILDLESFAVLTIQDLRSRSAVAQSEEVQTRANRHALAPFELAQGPLFKAELLLLNEQESVLLLNWHHIISDGWSMGVFVRDWQHAYTALAQGEAPSLPALPLQYGDYAAWQRQWLQGEVLQQQVDYWQQQLAGVPSLLELPTDKPRPAQQSYHGAHYSQRLSPTLTAAITTLSHQHGVTVFMTLLTTFYILLSRYSRQADLCVGSPIANRTHRQTEDLIGFFVNTLVLRAQLQPQQNFLDLLQATRQTCLAAYAHQDIPFEMLVEQLQPTRSLSQSPLFQVMFVLQNNEPLELTLPDLEITALTPDYPIAKFDLTLSLAERDGQWHGEWEYATDLFAAETIERLAGHFEVLLTAVVANPTQTISHLPMLTVAEVQQLRDWNDTAVAYPQDLTLVDLFEQQVAKTPENLAVVFETQSLTYRQLNEKANQLAHYLLDLTTFKKLSNLNGLSSPNPLIAIAVERSLEMVIGLLGILKAGGAYVPIDPSYPAARIHYMLADSAAPLLLTQSHLRAPLSLETLEHECVVVCLEEATWAGQLTVNPLVNRQVEDLVYVIYTSGSTGKPKGCQVTQSNVTRLFATTQTWYHFNSQDVWTLFHSYAFDFSVWEMWGALLYGAKLVVVPYFTSRTPEAFYQLLLEQRVTVLNQTPSAFRQLLTVDDQPANLSLRLVIFGGEALDFNLLPPWFDRHGEKLPQLVNMYGITETTVHVTYYPLRNEPPPTKSLIGIPLPDLHVWVVDAHQQPVPIGIPGEMYVGGAGLARGYLNHPDLTAAKFIEVELFGQTERIYKTGDLARWRPDGNLEYLGRLDHQVKLRGFRIELGEIEAVISQHAAVKEAVVTLYEANDNKRLVAYLTTDADSKMLVTALKDWLTARLPDYMIPSHFTILAKLPLTPNGKIDRQALPAPVLSTLISTPPVTPTEDLLASLWARVLKREAINREDNFFELGGHSLLATQLIARIRESFQVELPVRAIFEHPQLASLATAIAAATGTVRLSPIEVQPANAPQLLSFAQQRLWFLTQLEENKSATYNMPVALRLTGNLKVEALQQSLHWLLERHTSLRSAFPTQDGRATVQILDLESFAVLTIQDLRSRLAVAQSEDVQTRINRHALTPFELAQGPLFKAELLLLNEQESVLLLNWHHIISDGWSMGVFVRDWQHAYTALAQGEAPSLPLLLLQYGDYAAWQRHWLQGEVLQQQVDYWQQQLAGVPSLLELPTDKPRPAQQSYHGAHYSQRLSPTLTAAITSLSHQHGVTVFMTLLTTFYILLSRYSRQTDLCVGSPIANRTHRQTEDLIGFFVNTLVLRAQLQPQQNFLDLLRATRQTCLAAYAHQDLPFEMLVEQLQPTRSLSHSPLFQVMFVLQNNEPVELTLPDLEITALTPAYPIAKFDLTLSLEERDGQWHGEWEYATDLFAAATIERMAGHFEVLLTAVVANPTQAISHLPMLTAAEVQQLRAWNDTAVAYPQDLTLVDLFEQQVAKTPENLAVVFETQSLTYRQLNEKANQLAHYLLDLTTFKKLSNLNGLSSPNPLIAIAVERSLEMVIGLLGILKAGGAYVPIDPSYPAARIRYLLEDSAAPWLLTQSHLKAPLSLEELEHECVVVCLEEATWAGQATVNPLVSRQATDLAYVIYTSGSTGKPKGVMVEHQALTLHGQAMLQQYTLTKHDRVLQFASFSFDTSLEQVFLAWLSGACAVLVKTNLMVAPEFFSLLKNQVITVADLPPAFWQLLLANGTSARGLPALRLLILGGEALPSQVAQQTREGFPALSIFNAYGPTEAVITPTLYRLPVMLAANTTSVAIGRPRANTRIYILDAHHQPQPPGIPGELCIAGAGLARGYLNRPDLTAAKFIEVELFGQTERIYKTGDLARWCPDGNLEYLGRLDHQVKLRGFRIELGEIEAVLSQHAAVKEAVVTLYEADDNKRLVAYLTTDADSSALVTTLKDWLTARLPDYMIPSQFTVLEKLPLTPNGKLDRQALPAPVLSTLISTPPVTPTEDLLASLWARVLKHEAINREDNFFELGGHSLLATQLIARIRESFQVELPVRAVFEHPQLSSLATAIAAATGTVRLPPIEVQPANAPQLLSFAQQRLWFLSQLEENESATYNMPVALRLTGNLKVEALQQSLRWLLERHTSLRSAFPTQDGHATVQILDLESFAVLTIQDLRSLSAVAQSEEVQTRTNRHALAPFELAQGPLFKAELLLLNEQESVLLLNWHHIISDGWSMGVFVRDWQQAYTALAQGEAPSLPPLPLQYGDYAVWQRHWLQGEVLQQQLDYWHQQLAGMPSLLELPTDKPRPAQQSYHGAHYSQRLSPTLTTAITSLSHQHGVTVFMTLLTSFYILLSRYSRQTDLCVGSPIANRTHRQTEDLIGFFVNTLVLRAQLQPQQSFLDLLQATRQTCLAAYAHQDLPFEMLVEQLQPTRSLSQSPLFQVMFILQNNEPIELTLPDLEITALSPNYPIAKFDLTLSLAERDGQWHGEWEYATDLFAAETIERMAGHFEVLLTAVVANPTQAISHLPMLTATEVQQLRAWNDTAVAYPQDLTLVDLFEQQVAKTPENLAVVFETQSLTYRQLNEKANQLAHYLLDLTTFKKLSNLNGLSSPNPLIAIAVERSLEMVIGLLGILKAGGAYVPIDPSYPTARIHYMLEDSAAPLLLTQSHLRAPLSLEELEHECVVVCLEEATWAGQPTENPQVSRQVTDLAYVIYTSGSTGKPKGVMIEHHSLLNFLLDLQPRTGITSSDHWLAVTTLSFDIAALELYLPLISGSFLHLASRVTASDGLALQQQLLNPQINFLQATPATWQLLKQSGWSGGPPLNILCGGEALPPELANYLKALGPRVWNVYGPTETTIWSAAYPLPTVLNASPAIGHPIANTRIYILDAHHQPQPPGVPGELCIAGAGLARGYLNRPDLTAAKFIEVELFGQTERIYKTGDLARWRFDGNLEYLGRLDHQVKLRGFRIELGEIEAVLSQHAAVKEAVVTLYEADDNKRLVAYLTTDADSKTLVTTLKDWLTARLPDYMIPSHFIVLEKLPLTPNGKLDRQALPAPVLSTLISAPPATPTEDLLASLWAGVIKREAINREDNFFELGGHSLLATQLIARIRESFQVELPVRAIFEHPQLASLATAITAATGTVRLPPIEVQPAEAPQRLSFAQQRLWFLTQLEENKSATYNMPVALRLTGNLKVEALQQSLHWLLERHTSLRSTFPTQDGRATVQILDLESFAVLTIQDLRSRSAVAQSEEVQTRANRHALAPFELAQGPLFKAELLLLNEQESVLLLNWHHIISDGWSMGVFVRDWQHAYTALAQGEAPSLPALPLQYGDYAAWQRQWLQGEVLQQQVDYWQQQLAGVPALLELPTAKPRPAQQSYHGAHYPQRLSPTLTAAITTLSHQHGVTVFMTLLTTFYILLSRYSRQEDVCVGSPIANRTHRQTEDLIGFFVNTLVLRAQLQPQQSFLDLLRATRQTCLAAYAHQDLPFEMLVEQLQPTRSLSHSPLFQVMFVLQNNEPVELTLPDLEITALTPAYPIAKFDLTLSLEERDGQWHGEWEYATDLFAAETIERLAGHFEVLLTAVVANPMQAISHLPMLTAAEVQQLRAWNDTTVAYPTDLTLVDLFEQQVSKTPDNLAVVFETQSLTYRQLNEKANQLAHYLLDLTTFKKLSNLNGLSSPNPLIAIAVERSLEMVIGLLGILKAGGAYVPIDPSYPAARIHYMLEDSAAPLLLTQSHLKAQLSLETLEHECVVVCLEEATWAGQATVNPLVSRHATDLAYVIYTSGSTGKPKGVMVEHSSVVNLLLAFETQAPHTIPLSGLFTVPFSFDLSVWEIFSQLCYGGALHVLSPEKLLETNFLVNYLLAKQISSTYIPPTFLELVAKQLKPVRNPLQRLLVGVEPILQKVLQVFRTLAEELYIINGYGPTEATVCATFYQFVLTHDGEQRTPIGKPVANYRIYILNADNQPQPPGVPGELCIAGAGLARGYLNRPDLTAAKFIEVELFGQTERIYKTGDLARWRPDGNLEYLGRLDHQVKLRGFRIELGEIEAVLCVHPAVKEAVVTLYEADDNKRLVAYLTTDSESPALVTTLKDWLTARLPDYMIPSHFTILAKLPLTPNGKLDRQALPAPEWRWQEEYEAPRNDREQQLAQIWSRLLKQTNLSIHDNFFEVGGDSILSIQIVAQARQAGLLLTPRDLFQHQTIAELATVVRVGVATTAEPGLVTGEVPLTPIQQWFFAQALPEPWHFNQSILLRVPTDLKVEALRQAFATVLLHHDALRLRYTKANGIWQQFFSAPEDTVPLAIEDLSSSPDPVAELYHLTQRYQTNLNLTTGPVTYLVLLKWQDSARLFWCIHHLVVDGVSWRILQEDLQQAYTQLAAGQRPQLPAKTSSFKAWAERLASYAHSEVLAAERAYWQALPTVALPVANPTGENRLEQQRHETITLSHHDTEALLREVPVAYNTRINEVLLTALALTLAEWTGKPRCLIDLEGHGRVGWFEDLDLSRTVGWFTTIHPVALTLPNDTTDLGAALKTIKEQLRAIPQAGIGYGLLTQRGDLALPKGEILFNYLGQFDLGTAAAGFDLAPETTGSDISLRGERDHLIDINGAITQGQLYLTWSYSSDCYQGPTIAALAVAYQNYLVALIRHCQKSAEKQPQLETLLPLHQHKDALATLFCLPGLGSKAGYFLPLAKALKALEVTLSVSGLESPGLNGQAQIPMTVEALAQFHLEQIRLIQPAGPYYLVGHSFGAAVALEMAWRFEQAGESLALLAILDQPTSQYSFKPEEPETEFDLLWNIVEIFMALTEVKPPFTLVELKHPNSLNYAYRTVMNWLKQEKVHELLFSVDGLPAELQALVKVYGANLLAYSAYQPQGKQLHCAIDLFGAAESMEHNRELPEGWGWKEHTRSGVNRHQVTGSHVSMVRTPHVQSLAEKLTNLLTKGK